MSDTFLCKNGEYEERTDVESNVCSFPDGHYAYEYKTELYND
jgi:hypothetical protein